MTTLHRATLRNACRVTVLAAALILALPLARADDLTGLPVDDPKDLLPSPAAPAQSVAPTGGLFAPMPSWARGVTLGPMPDKLLPMGRDPKAALTKPQPLAPPKDTPDSSSTPVTSAVTKPSPDPAFIAVSPFLQWIKANPQAAANEARQQAEAYHGATAPEGTPAGATPVAPRNPQDDAYWLPPLIDSSNFGAPGPTAVTGSAAIYTRPQR